MKAGNSSDATLADRRGGPTPREIHIKDLFKVVLSHWRLVFIMAAMAAGGAYISGRDAIVQYQSVLTVQVSSRKQVFARMDDIDVDELALRTDPVRSEALVLNTQRLAIRVVDALQLQLEMVDPSAYRNEEFQAIVVDSDAPQGHYVLLQTGPPGSYELQDEYSSTVIWSGQQGEPVEGPGFSFQVVKPELPSEGLRFRIVNREVAAAWVRGGISHDIVSQTNAVNIWFTSTDRSLVPHVLNQAAYQLQQDGKDRALGTAQQRVGYIETELEGKDTELQTKLSELQTFKEDQFITDLSAEEQAIVQSIRILEQQKQDVLIQISGLRDAAEASDTVGIDVLNRLAALEGLVSNTAVVYQIENLLNLYDQQRTLTAGALGLRESNPQVEALNQRILSGHAVLRTAVDAALEGLENRRDAFEGEISDLRSRLLTFPGKETRIAQLEIERDILQDTYSYLLGQFQQAQLQAATISHYVEILDGASPPARVGTDLRGKVLLGLLVGILLGLGGAFFLEYLDQTIKTAADVERVIGVPVLGLIPHETKLVSRSNGAKRPVVAINALGPDDPTVEAFRSLRTNVTFVAAERPIQLLAVSSPGPGEGKSTATVNLAMALAQSNSRVLLVDGDMRRPVVHRAFQLVTEPGLTDILVGNATLRETARPELAPKLDVLPSGPRPPNPSELLGSDAMRHFLDEVRKEYDFVVIDTPPILPVTDAVVVGSVADAMVVVLRSGDTEEQAAQRAINQLRRVHTRVAGVVLNGVSLKHEQYHTYYSYGSTSRRERSPGKGLISRLSKIF